MSFNDFKNESLVIIPFGVRCSTKSILQRLGLQFPTMAFDWSQMNIDSMITALSLEDDKLNEFYTNYFNEIDKDTKKHKITQSWFPHDMKGDEMIDECIKKYIKRTERLKNNLKNPNPKLILCIFSHTKHNGLASNKLALKLLNFLKNNYINFKFLTINAGSKTIKTKLHTNFVIPVNDSIKKINKLSKTENESVELSWIDWENRIGNKLIKYLHELNISLIYPKL